VTPFKVGLLVLLSGAAFAAFFSFVKKGGLKQEDALTTFAVFQDASGLGPKSRVQIAGITVGEVADISLVGNRARITLEIKREIPVKVDAAIAKRSESLLGDYLLDLVPGSESAEPMPEGGEIKTVLDRGGVDEVFQRLNKITADIQQVTAALNSVLGGDKGVGSLEQIIRNLVQLSTTMGDTIRSAGEKLTTVLANFEGFSEDIRSLTEGQERNYQQIIINARGITEDVRDVLRTVKQVLGAGEGEIKDSVASLKQTLSRLDDSLKNLQSVTSKVDRGEGTLGQLVNDRALGENLASVVEDASDFVGRVVRLEAEVSLRSEFHLNQLGAKNYLQLRLIPKPDKYYFFEIVDDPRGVSVEQTVQRLPPDANERELQTQVITRQQLKFSAQFAKRFYFVTLRFGITESTGGVGGNLHFLNDALSFRVDLFEFSAQNKTLPRLKAYANYAFLGHLFFTMGIDDALNSTVRDRDLLTPSSRELGSRAIISGRDVFLGGGVYFNDDDLKAVLSALPRP
jgi:phospholipid/cholesterol/gamma-HCH transport system substrate-binding protein